ncbi:MAG: RHS repeat-associated core domain-containing protein [Candidatus Saccharicenans sp.]
MAEYQPAQNKYYFYTTDQINSTRLVTDENGNVVYAAVHDPYGGIHHTWANAFDPVWKFSGKEQDAEPGLNYFGARYYDPTLYRFLSPDPVNMELFSISNLQRWNRYSYCIGNPISQIDYEGLLSLTYTWIIYYAEVGKELIWGGKMKPYGVTRRIGIKIDFSDPDNIKITATYLTYILKPSDPWWKTYDAQIGHVSFEQTIWHEFSHIRDVHSLVRKKLEKLEKRYKEGKISKDEFEKNVSDIFNRAEAFSIFLRDNWMSEALSVIGRWVESMFPDYNNDPFTQWLLDPFITGVVVSFAL